MNLREIINAEIENIYACKDDNELKSLMKRYDIDMSPKEFMELVTMTPIRLSEESMADVVGG